MPLHAEGAAEVLDCWDAGVAGRKEAGDRERVAGTPSGHQHTRALHAWKAGKRMAPHSPCTFSTSIGSACALAASGLATAAGAGSAWAGSAWAAS